MCDELDRLRAENETLRSMHAELTRRIEVLTEWQREACEEFEDIRSQWGSDYLWEKHNEKPVVDLLRRAGKEAQ